MPGVDELGRRLLAVQGELTEALAKKDWERMAAIDARIRELLQALAGREPEPELQRAKRALQRLHGQALQACAKECERLRRLLLTHLEYAEGRSAYMRTEMYGG
ncbi:hypothetical protein BZL41_17830 [Pseudomonas sp. PIC25]|uniref:hypothetical protein n=1 Tax=Pseudomonas sp. PIC25 TaxID=1958773 RepID=UPI000BABB7E3|nr:hypothetical protein [Pseudomonas sp. PIC25]PAU58380.1 hypothetical protein BZL41_17830 [Pseudomonas sp. PIC25]